MKIRIETLKSNKSALSFLNKASKASTLEGAYRTHPHLSSWFKEIEDLKKPFTAARHALLKAYVNRRQATKTLTEVRKRSARCIFHFKRSIDYRMEWHRNPEWYRNHYEVPFENNAYTESDETLLTVLETLIHGDTEAEAAGFEPIREPSRKELNDCLEKLNKALNGMDHHEKVYAEASQNIALLLRKVQLARRGLVSVFRIVLDDMGNATIRNILKRYGVTFTYKQDQEETEPPEDSGENGDLGTVEVPIVVESAAHAEEVGTKR